MKIAAKPAVTSSDAGISAINSRLRALTESVPCSSCKTRFSASSFERSLWSVNVERRRAGTFSNVTPEWRTGE